METDVVIVGAGAAGLMCAVEAGRRGRRVLVIDHSPKIAEKIRISGGGRCNFTNIHTSPANFISSSPHFCKSALSQYTQHDFIAWVKKSGIAFHEKTLGQLFCDRSANDIINMLLNACKQNGVQIWTETKIESIENGFNLKTSEGDISCQSLVIASGGLSIPKIGASPFGYEVAKQFGLAIIPVRAALVPLVFDPIVLNHTKELSGISIEHAEITSKSGKSFQEGMLFTHRGVSGPSILQISSYWQPGEEISIDMAADIDVLTLLKDRKKQAARSSVISVLTEFLPKRLAQMIIGDYAGKNMADLPDKVIADMAGQINRWAIKPSGSEGYRTAEVTLGGVDTDELSSKTFESHKMPGLYFIGEVVDVTGHLGGFNFQWAWSSGWCAGQNV